MHENYAKMLEKKGPLHSHSYLTVKERTITIKIGEVEDLRSLTRSCTSDYRLVLCVIGLFIQKTAPSCKTCHLISSVLCN